MNTKEFYIKLMSAFEYAASNAPTKEGKLYAKECIERGKRYHV